MPFVTTPERYGRKLGILEAIEVTLHVKFGEAGVALLPEIKALNDPEKFLAVHKAILMATSLDEVQRACTKAAAPPARRPRKKGENGKRRRS